MERSVGKKILIYMLLASCLFSMLTTSIQLYIAYKSHTAEVKQKIEIINAEYLDHVATNFWQASDLEIQKQLDKIKSLSNLSYVEFTEVDGKRHVVGEQTSGTKLQSSYSVVYQNSAVGTLSVEVSYQSIHSNLIGKFGLALLTQLLQNLLIACLIVLIIYRVVLKHLYKIVDYGRALSVKDLDQTLVLDGERLNSDELDLLANSINNMRLTLKSELNRRLATENELMEFNRYLESKVKKRTHELEQSFDQLNKTQENLIQSEKMAALGQLVAGIAHEINTPLGISVTANSYMVEKMKTFTLLLEDSRLSRAKLTQFIEDQTDSALILERNLQRAVELITSFKSVAVNQTNDTLILCDINKLVEEILNTVKVMFKTQNYTLNITVEDSLFLQTYPGAWTQILTNLLMNSHVHGFEHTPNGVVTLNIYSNEDSFVIDYQDDGTGIPVEIISKVFDPFVTTKRGNGGSGLGLNILFNLVYEKLKGTVHVQNLDAGCQFIISCPKQIDD